MKSFKTDEFALRRRLRCLANYEKANKDLDMVRARNKDVALAENK